MAGASTIKQKADAEAARAEAEHPDEPAEAEPTSEPDSPEQPEPTPEQLEEDEANEEGEDAEEQQAAPSEGRSDKQTQAMFERAVNAFRAKLCDVFGVEDLEPTQVPGVIGFVLPGFTEQKTHEDFTRCQTCNGYGTVLTGSIKEGDKTRPCPDGRCKGRGYWERLHAQPAPPPPAAALTGPTAYEQPQPANGSQEWGEAPAWMGDPRLTAPSTP